MPSAIEHSIFNLIILIFFSIHMKVMNIRVEENIFRRDSIEETNKNCLDKTKNSDRDTFMQ